MKEVGKLKYLALSKESDISDLVRFSLYLSEKFNESEMVDFLTNELNGYPEFPFPPFYRVISGVWKIRRNMGAPITVEFPHNLEHLNSKIICDGVSNIFSCIERSGEYIFLRQDKKAIDQELRRCIKKQNPSLANNPIYLAVHKSEFSNILEQVRNKILDWIFELENKSIFGDEIESKESVIMQNNFIQNGNGNNQANVIESPNSTVNQTLKNMFKGDFNYLASNLRSHGVEDADIQVLQTIIDVTPLPQSPSEYSPDLKGWMSKMIGKSIDGTWQVAVGAAGSLLATGLQQYFGILG